jgi:SAM-dependent methyltransferase
VKLDLGCGQRPREGYIGVDLYPGSAVVQDLQKFPWPWKEGSVDEVYSSHLVEHLPDLIGFMNEVHRILKPGGICELRHPYCMNVRAFQDPTHVRFIPEQTWYYFNLEWRKLNGLDHYPITTDFEVVVIFGDGIEQNIAQRNTEAQQYARTHYWNVIADLVVKLKKKDAVQPPA